MPEFEEEKTEDVKIKPYWIFQPEHKRLMKFGKEPEKCLKVGHIAIKQQNMLDKTMHSFCVNCGKEFGKEIRSN